jgi:hypothetical protein
MLRISIYCFTHPHKGVGGRRWREFSKRLSDRGHEVTITSGPWYGSKPELNLGKVKLRFLQRSRWRRFPFRENRRLLMPVWFFQKKIWELSGGGYSDNTDGLSRSIRKCVQSDVTRGVDVIIVSVAPFHWALKIGSVLEESSRGDRPKFIVDFRDPWSSNEIAYLVGASEDWRRIETEREERVLKLADEVLLVHLNIMKPEHYVLYGNKVRVVPNGAKMTEITNVNYRKDCEVIRAVFLGTLYDGSCSQFLTALTSLNDAAAQVGKGFHCVIAGSWLPKDLASLESLSFCKYVGYVSREEVDYYQSRADMCVSVVSGKMNFAMNTKILESISNLKPIFLISDNGEVSRFISENNLGFHWCTDSPEDSIRALSSWLTEGMPFGPSKSQMIYDLDVLTRKLESVLNGVCGRSLT